MDCPEEFAPIRSGLASLTGIVEVQPDYLRRSIRVELRPNDVDESLVSTRLADIGFPAASPPDSDLMKARRMMPVRVSVAVGGVLLAASTALWLASSQSAIVPWLLTATTVVCGARVAQAGWRAARHRRCLRTAAAVSRIGPHRRGFPYQYR